MQASDQMNRQRVLRELNIGPLWLLRQADTPSSALAAIESDYPAPVEQIVAPTGLPAAEVGVADSVPIAKADPVATPEIAFNPAPEIVQARPPEAATSPGVRVPVSAMSWDELQLTVETCVNCGLCQGRKKAVFGTGDRQAKWLFVGEGPGYNENLQGLPFVGAAGQLLDNMLKTLGVRRGEQAYIANIVKCRPTDGQGKDRPPTAEEIAACLPYLHRQIALIQPEVIVALGKTAAVSLLGLDLETPIGQLRGKVHQFQAIPMVATYHPAYLLRKPTEKNKAWIDLCLAQKAMLTR